MARLVRATHDLSAYKKRFGGAATLYPALP
jgi:hypothetical protein